MLNKNLKFGYNDRIPYRLAKASEIFNGFALLQNFKTTQHAQLGQFKEEMVGRESECRQMRATKERS